MKVYEGFLVADNNKVDVLGLIVDVGVFAEIVLRSSLATGVLGSIIFLAISLAFY